MSSLHASAHLVNLTPAARLRAPSRRQPPHRATAALLTGLTDGVCRFDHDGQGEFTALAIWPDSDSDADGDGDGADSLTGAASPSELLRVFASSPVPLERQVVAELRRVAQMFEALADEAEARLR